MAVDGLAGFQRLLAVRHLQKAASLSAEAISTALGTSKQALKVLDALCARSREQVEVTGL